LTQKCYIDNQGLQNSDSGLVSKEILSQKFGPMGRGPGPDKEGIKN